MEVLTPIYERHAGPSSVTSIMDDDEFMTDYTDALDDEVGRMDETEVG
jgi:hypothetical protein